MDGMCSRTGYIELFLGCMFAGKTSELYRKTSKLDVINRKYLIINHSIDKRFGDNMIVTHNKLKKPCMMTSKLMSIIDNQHFIDAMDIFVEEGQFFDDLKEFVLECANKYGKNIYVFGLDGDFNGEMFKSIKELLPHADKYSKLTAFCKSCNNGTKALYSHLIKKEDVKGNVIVGSYDKFIPLCRKCFFDKNK